MASTRIISVIGRKNAGKTTLAVALASELTEAGCDWQIHAYGHTGHGFTNPKAHELQIDGVFYVRVFSLSSGAISRYSLEVALQNAD